MKALLLILALALGVSSAKSQCTVSVNDSLYSNFDYVLNATNVTGQAPFQFTWTVTDGNGLPMSYTQSSDGDSITITAQTLQNSYGCVIYQLCMTDNLGCTTCTMQDTSALQVPFNCASSFTSSIVGPNQVAITTFGNIPAFLIQQQFMQWNDGNGQSQGMPYMGPGTTIVYTPGPQNPSDKFYLCVMTILTNGGCISCDSVQYTVAGIDELAFDFTVHPNPASDFINITSEKEFQSYAIVDLQGQIIEEKFVAAMKDAEIAVGDLPKGIYMLRVNYEGQYFLHPFVKQ